MGESTKSALAIVIIAGMALGMFAWAGMAFGDLVWEFRIGAPVCALLALALLLKLHLRKDYARDFLLENCGEYFNRDGFCFTCTIRTESGVAYMEAYFQSQYDQPCVGQIAIRPWRGVWLNGVKADAITYNLKCGPAALGVATVPIPVPAQAQGQVQVFEVGAAVHYPQGKGRRVRFRDGIFLRANSHFQDAMPTALTVAGAVAGAIVISTPARLKMVLPIGVADVVPDGLSPEVEMLWEMDAPADQWSARKDKSL